MQVTRIQWITEATRFQGIGGLKGKFGDITGGRHSGVMQESRKYTGRMQLMKRFIEIRRAGDTIIFIVQKP